jgi:hypothetical protein
MIIQLDTNNLYATFSVDNFTQLENSFNTLAPSMVDYYLSSLVNDDEIYVNQNNIQHTIYLDDYTVYLGYDNNIYLKLEDKADDEHTIGSLW